MSERIPQQNPIEKIKQNASILESSITNVSTKIANAGRRFDISPETEADLIEAVHDALLRTARDRLANHETEDVVGLSDLQTTLTNVVEEFIEKNKEDMEAEEDSTSLKLYLSEIRAITIGSPTEETENIIRKDTTEWFESASSNTFEGLNSSAEFVTPTLRLMKSIFDHCVHKAECDTDKMEDAWEHITDSVLVYFEEHEESFAKLTDDKVYKNLYDYTVSKIEKTPLSGDPEDDKDFFIVWNKFMDTTEALPYIQHVIVLEVNDRIAAASTNNLPKDAINVISIASINNAVKATLSKIITAKIRETSLEDVADSMATNWVSDTVSKLLEEYVQENIQTLHTQNTPAQLEIFIKQLLPHLKPKWEK